jgi:S-DNA-T family DNA segregation ATPase FtsK/SpoIIIE
MEAPIPGKAAIGIEIPNSEIAPVRLREVLETSAFRASDSLLTVGLGKDIAGNPVVAELDRMPHLLIAGATGSGKSVCLNVLIASLLFRASPAEVRLILIDPKVVELQQFDGIPHLLYPVVTDPKRAAGVLRGVLREMEERYLQFARAGCRDIQRYNEVADERMPYYVVVIDELADLMMVAPNEVEETIARLAQMARAAGIHLVVATQRPSVDVITGLIKANIPSRIAFAVSSQVDSRTILDQGGAERLLGKGDMLFAPLGLAKPLRTQGAYVSEQEMQHLLEFVRQDEPEYRDDLEAPLEDDDEQEPEVDALFAKAVEVVVQAKSASASLLQSRMRVGYSRARRLIEQMEQRGIVGPPDGSRPREVRLSQFDFERMFPPETRG